MTEEEKKAIEYLRLMRITNFKEYSVVLDKEKIDAILNLIEKLQKENEELKNKVVKRDKELIKLEEYANKNFERKDDVKAKYIPKDKIREIIEELNKNIEEEFKKCSGRGPTIALHSLTFCRDEFKELLEEE